MPSPTTSSGTAGLAFADAGASGAVQNSPGVLSGNTAQIPVNIPVQAVGNSIDVTSTHGAWKRVIHYTAHIDGHDSEQTASGT
nr:chaplin [Streptomyces longisporoflavus]